MRGERWAGGQVYADGPRLRELRVRPLHPRILRPRTLEVHEQLRRHRRESRCETTLPLRWASETPPRPFQLLRPPSGPEVPTWGRHRRPRL